MGGISGKVYLWARPLQNLDRGAMGAAGSSHKGGHWAVPSNPFVFNGENGGPCEEIGAAPQNPRGFLRFARGTVAGKQTVRYTVPMHVCRSPR